MLDCPLMQNGRITFVPIVHRSGMLSVIAVAFGGLLAVEPARADTVLEVVYPAQSGGPPEESCSPQADTSFTIDGVGTVTVRLEWTGPVRSHWARQRFFYWHCEGPGCEGFTGVTPPLGHVVSHTMDPDPHVPDAPAVMEWVFDHTRAGPANLSTAIEPLCICPGTRQSCTQSAEQFRLSVIPGAGVTLTIDRPGTDQPETAAPETGEIVTAVTISNGGAVQNRPAAVTTFTLDRALYLTQITTYHWNAGNGAAPGTISLRAPDGRILGPWVAEGRPGSGAQNVNWVARPDLLLSPGIYTVIDSDPATWSQNAGTGGAGFVWVDGVWQ